MHAGTTNIQLRTLQDDDSMSVKVEQPADVSGKTEIQPQSTPLGVHQPIAAFDPLRMQQPGLGGQQLNPNESSDAQSQEQPAASSNARVPLPPQSSQGAPAPSPTGPMSSSWTPAPRPRPGRKPIPQEDAADRRRLQNRIAQRNFRDKRQQKLYETQQELEERKHEYQEHINGLQRQLEELRQERRRQVDDLTRRLDAAEQRAQAAEKEKQQLQQMYPNRGAVGYPSHPHAPFPSHGLNINTSRLPTGYSSAMPTPPEDNGFVEIDFTYHFRPAHAQSTHTNALRPTVSNDSVGSGPMDYTTDGNGMNIDDRCGFCTDDQNCACRNEQEQIAKQRADERAPTVATAPGSCADCLRDPERAQACRDLAMGARFDARPSTGDGSRLDGSSGSDRNSSGTSIMGPPPQRMSCGAMVDRFNEQNQRTASVSSLLNHGEPMHAYPSASGGYEFEEHEAAHVLSNLSRRSTIVSQPESNERGGQGTRGA